MIDRLGMFEASFVHLQEDEHVVMVSLADDQFDTTNYIILQRTLCPSEQDVSLGQDSVHLMVCDQERSGYGGLLGVLVSNEQVVFTVDQNTADLLQVTPQLIVGTASAGIDAAVLGSKLQQVCGKHAPVQTT